MMGNNKVCKVISLKSISLNLYDETITEVQQVRHVLDLKRNLISLGMLNQIGSNIRLESGEMKITNGHTLVIK